MTHRRVLLGLLALAALSVAALAQPAQPGSRNTVIIYKDGYVLKGKVSESVREVIYDSASGRPFAIPSGNFSVDDHVRDLIFSPSNIQKVIQFKPGEIKPPMQVRRIDFVSQTRQIHPSWTFPAIGKWTDTGDREVSVKTPKGAFTMDQKIGIFTPQFMKAVTIDYEWNMMYFTQEFGPEQTRKMLMQVFSDRKDLKKLKDSEKYMQIAAFMQEAGWFKEAEKELMGIIENYPTEKKLAQEMLDKLKRDRAGLFVEDLEKLANVGQHATALERLETYADQDYQKFVTPKQAIIAADLKTKYKKADVDIANAKAHLKSLGGFVRGSKTWTRAIEAIGEELNQDTIGKLETFLLFAEQYQMDRAAGRKQMQTPEEVLAIGASGWLQGNNAAEPDVKSALKMLRAREFFLDYLSTDGEQKRATLLNDFKAKNDLPVDVLTRLLRMIPPPLPPEAKDIHTNVQTVTIDVPNGNGGKYLLQLPPDYQPLRAYPVMIVLHSGREKADETLRRFTDEAARYGFILVAPLWAGNGFNPRYQYSAKEHNLVLDTITDLRRKFQIDSDRVSMFGWEDGGSMAVDIGLSHPDQFANVTVMNGAITPFARRFYWTNAQYLPFYVIEGDRNGNNPKAWRDLFKDWTREPFTCLYVEYKGRGSEWYGVEIPKMFDWASRKRRHNPMKEMGRPSFGVALGEEFRSSRDHDNRFYWLRCDDIPAVRTFADHRTVWKQNFQPAVFQAHISVGNEKSGKEGAKIWNQVNINASPGVKGLSFWVAPGMFADMSLPLSIRVNSAQVGGMRKIEASLDTMIEELYQTGDRQRLFIAKVDIKQQQASVERGKEVRLAARVIGGPEGVAKARSVS